MTNEDYVSFEIANLLKEKGFNCNVSRVWFHYTESKEWNRISFDLTCEKFDGDKMLKCPTLQMAMKWLLDTYKLYIVPTPYPHEDGVFYWAYKIAFLDSNTLAVMVVRQKSGFDSKEDACETAIKYCFEKLI